MHEGGKILAKILGKLSEAVRPGIATQELEKLARELVLSYKVKPAFLGYGGYPAVLCASVSDEVVHGEPSARELKESETVSLDMGIIYDGFYLDSAVTVPVLGAMGMSHWIKSNPELNRLLEVTKEALGAGIKEACIGNRVGNIGYAIQKVIEGHGLGVVRELVGHGIGRSLHEEPQIPNYGKKTDGAEIKEGMVLAIEPMVTLGEWKVKKDRNSSAYLTADRSPAAHFEHTVAVTQDGPLVLTIA